MQCLATVCPNRLHSCGVFSEREVKKKGRVCFEEKSTKVDGVSITAVK
jgi:hypothetical protein